MRRPPPKDRVVWQNLSHFLTRSPWYSPALKPQHSAAAVSDGRPLPRPPPPPHARLYCTPPSSLVLSLRYLMLSLMPSFGTMTPALRAARRACTWVMVTEPSSKLLPSLAET